METGCTKKIALALLMFASFSTAHAYRGVEYTYTSGGAIKDSGGTTIGTYCTGAPTAGKYSSASYSGSSGCTNPVAGTDSDADTLPDTWETTYSLNKYNSSDRYADGDSDGCTNACEKARGAKPNDNDSDDDGAKDMDDAAPASAGSSSLNLNSTYKGRKVTGSNVAE